MNSSVLAGPLQDTAAANKPKSRGELEEENQIRMAMLATMSQAPPPERNPDRKTANGSDDDDNKDDREKQDKDASIVPRVLGQRVVTHWVEVRSSSSSRPLDMCSSLRRLPPPPLPSSATFGRRPLRIAAQAPTPARPRRAGFPSKPAAAASTFSSRASGTSAARCASPSTSLPASAAAARTSRSATPTTLT